MKSTDIRNFGTMQLRNIAKTMHVKNYAKLDREQLILTIVTRTEEMWQKQKQQLTFI